jgi:type I restriction enzyme S subunit
LAWWCRYAFADGLFASIASGANIFHLSAERVRGLPMRPIPETTQRAIADYLDAETARIDALIEKKQRMMSLLKEEGLRRQGDLAICHGTTRKKPSGHEWLGDVPEDWEIVRLKFVAKLESGHTPSRTRPELWENCDTPWVTLNDVGFLENHEYIDQTVNLISAEGLANSSARLLPVGTVILSRDATIGRSGILARPMATSQHFADWICSNRLRPRYLWLLFQTVVQRHLQSLTDGATLRTIGMPDIKELVIPLPPPDVQDSIVVEASRVRHAVERAVDTLQGQLALLIEHREALVTAAVTGELEIPGVAA